MQTLTDDLLDLLASRFQAAAQGFRGRIEVDEVVLSTPTEVDLALNFGTVTADSNEAFTVPHNPGNANDGNSATYSDRSDGVDGDAVAPKSYWICDLGTAYQVNRLRLENTVNAPITDPLFRASYGPDLDPAHEWARFYSSDDGLDWTEEALDTVVSGSGYDEWPLTTPSVHRYWRIEVGGMSLTRFFDEYRIYGFGVYGYPAPSGEVVTLDLRPRRMGIDKSRRLVAAQLNVELPNEAGDFIVAPDSLFQTNEVIRAYQWYGDVANEVRTATDLIDEIGEGRDVRTISLTARDMMKRLIDQTFSATAPQGAGEAGAVRTPANGVYLGYEVDDIVADILDRAGWPADQREITPTSYMLDEYRLDDGSSWADAIVGDDKLTGLTGYEAFARESDGFFVFRPLLAAQVADADTDPAPVYSYVVADDGANNLVSRNVIRLDHKIDDYDLRTRVKVRGSLATVKAAWTELWHTNSFPRPVGVWWNPATPGYLYVLDRSTKKIYRFQLSNRVRAPLGIWPLYVGGHVTYPLGLSGDPADSDRFWVLEAAWRVTGSANLNASIHKYDASSGAHLAEYSLPDGEWSDLKVTATHLVLTNKTTDKIHLRSKADGSAVGSPYTTVVNGTNQVNPTGVFVDGTTLGLFFLGKARFILVDESNPAAIDTSNALGVTSGQISTAGARIYGGEIDTATHAHLYTCNDDLGLVAKYALTEPSSTDIAVEVIDTDLEDELGFLAQAQPRIHDSHPSDPAHPFEIRRETITLVKTITNLAQATETAQRKLAVLAHRRETLDLGIVGHPGLQIGDLIHVTDPVTAIDALYVLDTYRDNMDDRGYLGTIALVPYAPAY